eukprot:12368357-Karenia_brevis.AAC.1
MRPIPSWVTKNPLLADNLSKIDAGPGADPIDPFAALALYKQNLRKAAKLTRDQLLAAGGSIDGRDAILAA